MQVRLASSSENRLPYIRGFNDGLLTAILGGHKTALEFYRASYPTERSMAIQRLFMEGWEAGLVEARERGDLSQFIEYNYDIEEVPEGVRYVPPLKRTFGFDNNTIR